MLNRWIKFLSFLLLFSISRAQESGDSLLSGMYLESHALLIGNSNYRTVWPKLPGVEQDLYSIKEVLELHGFEVSMGLDYTKIQMDSAYTAFIAAHGNSIENRLLFYYAGHGETVHTSYGEALSYLVPIDAPGPDKRVGDFQGKSMELTQVEIYAKRLQSKHALFLFDACFAGSIFGKSRALDQSLMYQLSQPVRQFITSGDADETVPDESIFRRELVRALQGSVADENNDGFLSGSELGTFLQDQVVEKTNGTQHPQFGKIRNPALDKGDFFFFLDPKMKTLTTRSIINPRIGEIAALERYGSLEIKSELKGRLLLDGQELTKIASNKPIYLDELLSGKYDLNLIGEKNWKGTVYIEAGQMTSIYIHPYINKARRNLFMPMTYVEAGQFEMGDSNGMPDQKPVHRVTLTDYEIGTYEVTVGQFKQFVDSTDYLTELEQNSGTHLILDREKGLLKANELNWRYGPDGKLVTDMQKPVVFVTWNDAMAFARWMSETFEGSFRLPTEAEWEFAAKGGIRNKNVVFDSIGLVNMPKFHRLLRIGDRNAAPNELGIFHMADGLSEWCLDWYDKSYYRRASKNEPMGPNHGEMKVIRGDSWITDRKEDKLTHRKRTSPNLCSFSDGFRVVRILE